MWDGFEFNVFLLLHRMPYQSCIAQSDLLVYPDVEGEWLDSYHCYGYQRYVICKESRPGFELDSLCPFHTSINTTQRTDPHKYIYIYIYICIYIYIRELKSILTPPMVALTELSTISGTFFRSSSQSQYLFFFFCFVLRFFLFFLLGVHMVSLVSCGNNKLE